MIFFRLLFLAFLSLPIAVSAQDQVRKSDVVRLLQKLQNEQSNADGLRALGFQGEKLDLMLAHDKQIANNQVILCFMADQLINAQLAGSQPTSAGGFLGPLLDRGMPYLPVDEQIYHMKVELTVMRAMSIADCGHAVKNIGPRRGGRSPLQTVAQLNAPALKEYLRIVRKASTAGATRSNPPNLSDATATRVWQAFSNTLQTKAAMQGLSAAYERAGTDVRMLSNKDACNLRVLIIETITETKGKDLRPLLQLYWRNFI